MECKTRLVADRDFSSRSTGNYRKLARMEGVDRRPSMVFNRSFSCFDAFSSTARGWDLDFLQLDRGEFRANLSQLIIPSVVLSRVSMGRKVFQRGQIPSGFRTFAFAAGDELELKWRGSELGMDGLMLFPRGEGLESVSLPGFDVFVLSISDWLLRDVAEARGLDSADELFPRREVIHMAREDRARLRSISSQLLIEAVGSPGRLCQWSFRETLENQLVGCLLEAVEGALEVRARPVLSPLRRLALSRGLELMNERAGEAVSIAEIEKLTGLSGRTLRHAFKEALGLSPKAYLQRLRLNRVRRELWNGDARVSEVASRWGFRHLGQFAVDYRRMFGERPSMTLGRSSGRP